MNKPNLAAAVALLAIAQANVSAAPKKTTTKAKESPNQQVVAAEYLKPGASRSFAIEYTGKVSGIPEGTKQLRVWVPVPQDSTAQTISDLTFSKKPRRTTEPKYGNTMAYWEIDQPAAAIDLTMKFNCRRKEILVDLTRLQADGKDPAARYVVFKKADRLVLVDEEMQKISNELTAGKQTAMGKARAIYDYVLDKMSYDKNHTGWGLGSTRHACDVGKGNCTDFHALFNSLCRAQGIASGFEIGLYLPYEKGRNEPLGGYHCWAFFRVPGKTWVPVDCSEADRFDERREFFFGAHTPNRVTLSTGRDIDLEPRQASEPLNYFLNPYAEADGKPVKTEKTWSYTEIE